MPNRPSMIQRCAPLISGPNWNASEDQPMPTSIDEERQPPHMAQRQERDRSMMATAAARNR